jgi:hypothetical protein
MRATPSPAALLSLLAASCLLLLVLSALCLLCLSYASPSFMLPARRGAGLH